MSYRLVSDPRAWLIVGAHTLTVTGIAALSTDQSNVLRGQSESDGERASILYFAGGNGSGILTTIKSERIEPM